MTAFKPYVTGEDESSFRQWLAYTFEQSTTGVAKTGVLTGLGVTATTPSPSGSVVVGKGAAVCQPSSQAFPLVEPADETFDVFTANPMQFVSNPRNDVIVLDQVTGLVKNLVGTPNAVPSSGEQSVPATAVPLARLRHAANATTIPTSVIDDLRVFTGLAMPAGTWVDLSKFAGVSGTLKYRQRGNTVDVAIDVTGTFAGGTFSSISAGGALPAAARPTITPARAVVYTGSGATLGTAEVTTGGTINVQAASAFSLAKAAFSYPAG